MTDSTLIVGVGPATGSALCHQLAGKSHLILVARTESRLSALAKEVPNTTIYPCDVSDREQWQHTLEQIKTRFGAPKRILVNTESAPWGEYQSLSLNHFANSFEVNVTALLQLVQILFPDPKLIAADSRIVVSSSPAAYQPTARFLGLAPSRVAQRALAEMLNEILSQSGLRFSVFSIDGAIDEPKMRRALPDQPTSFFIQPTDIASTIETLFQADEFPLRSGIRGASSFAEP